MHLRSVHIVAYVDNSPEAQSLFVGRTVDLISIQSGLCQHLQNPVPRQELNPHSSQISETQASANLIL